jgi:outer membrane protein assembly factor BamB
LATLDSQPQLLVQTRTSLASVDPESGEVLWIEEIPAFRGMNILTPSSSGDVVFTSSYGGRSFAFKVQGSSVEEAWTNKVQGYMSSPVIIDDHIYLHLRNQRFVCIDAQTGETKWTTKPFGKYWSMVANGNRILALDQRGELLLIDANPEAFTLLDSRKISEDETWAHLAVSGDQIFIRELNAIVAWQWR